VEISEEKNEEFNQKKKLRFAKAKKGTFYKKIIK